MNEKEVLDMARARLSNAIVNDYLRLIGEGEIAPGVQLPPESLLCEQYGVGRSVVREALQALDAKGFILVRQGSLAVVAPRHRWHILDQDFLAVNSGEEFFLQLQEARELLEPQLAALAAARADASVIDELESLNQRLEEAAAVPEEHAELDITFHDALARATGNPILISMHDSISGLGRRTRSLSAQIPGAIERALVWHRNIVEAVNDGDSEGAAAAMHLHLRQVRNELATLERSSGSPVEQTMTSAE